MSAALTIYTNSNGPLGKRIHFNADGRVSKFALAQLVSGTAERHSVTSLREFELLRRNLKNDQALGFGVAMHPLAYLATTRAIAALTSHTTHQGVPILARTNNNFLWPQGTGILMLDHDPLPGAKTLTGSALHAALCEALPELATVEMLWVPSAGSCIFDTAQGTELIPLRGARMYLFVDQATAIPEVGKLLFDRLALTGHAAIHIGSDGATHRRSIVDASVWQPSRLDFVHANCADGLEQRFQAAEHFGPEGNVLLANSLARYSLTPEERQRLRDIWSTAQGEVFAKATEVRHAWATDQAKKALGAMASPDQLKIKTDDFKRAAEGGRLDPAHVLHMEGGGEISVAHVLADLNAFLNTRFCDPMEPSYGDDDRIASVFAEPSGAVHIRSFAHGGRKYLLRGASTAEGGLAGFDAHPGAKEASKPSHARLITTKTPAASFEGSRRQKPSLVSLYKVLREPSSCGVMIARDEFDSKIKLSTSSAVPAWRSLGDTDMVRLRMALEQNSGFSAISSDLMRDSLQLVADDQSFDSAKCWLGTLEWDGTPRVERSLVKYFGVADSAYASAVSRYIWTALAGRILHPGLKCDMVPVAVGHQGARKSTTVAAMVPASDFFAEISLADQDDNLRRRIQGKLVCELAELQGLSGREAESIKAFLSATEDAWIPKYREHEIRSPRRCLFFGTSNHEDFLSDATGNRRWLPFKVGACDPAAMANDHEQLWAEGAELFRKRGLLQADAEKLAREVHVNFVSQDAWEPPIAEWLAQRYTMNKIEPASDFVTAAMVLFGALHTEAKNITRAHQMRLRDIMLKQGWVKARESKGHRAHGYSPSPETAARMSILARESRALCNLLS